VDAAAVIDVLLAKARWRRMPAVTRPGRESSGRSGRGVGRGFPGPKRGALHEVEQDCGELRAVFEGGGDALDGVGDDLLGSRHHAHERGANLG
jgi:hypothetical protein